MPFHELNIRIVEIDEILGKTPNSIIRWGVSVIFFIVFALVVGSWFFKYPDFINSTIEITSSNPPAEVVAKASGKIEELFVKNNQMIEAGKVLAMIENPAIYQDVIAMIRIVDSIEYLIPDFDAAPPIVLPTFNNLNLGELQPGFSGFVSSCNSYINYLNLGYYKQKISAVEKEIQDYRIYYNFTDDQKQTLGKDLQLAEKELKRYQALYEGQTIPESEFEQAQSRFLNKKYTFESTHTTLSSISIQISQLESSKLELKLQDQQTREALLIELNKTLKNLSSEIDIWKQKYILSSTISGLCTFTKFWNQNQHVVAGETVMTIIPGNAENIIGKLLLPIAGAGKVKAGQKVNIRLSNYPYMEFGLLEGVVQNISLISNENNYYVEVSFPNGIMTSYGYDVPFSQKMQGTAEVITDDIRLLSRIFNPVKALMKEQQGYSNDY